jgi:hypothetical protein
LREKKDVSEPEKKADKQRSSKSDIHENVSTISVYSLIIRYIFFLSPALHFSENQTYGHIPINARAHAGITHSVPPEGS